MSPPDLNYVLQSVSSNIDVNLSRRKVTIDQRTSEYYSPSERLISPVKMSHKPFNCPKCGRSFAVKGNMNRHLKYECGQPPKFQCPYCNFRSKQSSNVLAHVKTRHRGQNAYVLNLTHEA